MPQTDTRKNIKEFIERRGPTTPGELVAVFEISKQMLQRHLRSLMQSGQLIKEGKVPKVVYKIPEFKEKISGQLQLEGADRIYLAQNYLYISPDGEELSGVGGFRSWCEAQGLNFLDAIKSYRFAMARNEAYKVSQLINILPDFYSTQDEEVYLDIAYLLDFEQLEGFEQTKLGTLVGAAAGLGEPYKRELSIIIEPIIASLIEIEAISVIVVIPGEIGLNLSRMFKIPQINLRLISNELQVRWQDLQTIPNYVNILLLAERIESRPEFNHAAAVLRQKLGENFTGNVIGLGLVGTKN